MTSQARAERQRVFLAYRKAFTGKNARTRNKKAIRRIVQDQDCSSLVDIPIVDVVRILYILLRDRIFESEELASKEFPDLFKSFQNDQPIKRDVAIDMAIKGPEKHNVSLETPIKTEHEEAHNDVENLTRDTLHGVDVLAFQPLRFPFDTQHRFLSIIQQLLEESCFKFAEKRFPFILEKNGWTCAAAGELTKWLYILKRLPDNCISTEGQASLNSIYRTVAQLRHTVVHRLHVTSEQFLDMMRSARMLAEILQDTKGVSTLQSLYTDLCSHAQEMEQHKRTMQQEVHSRLDQIQRQKKVLVQMEQELHLYVAKQNVDIPVAAGQALDKSIDVLLAIHHPGIIVGEESKVGYYKHGMCTEYDVRIEEGDIESDEERLQKELE